MISLLHDCCCDSPCSETDWILVNKGEFTDVDSVSFHITDKSTYWRVYIDLKYMVVDPIIEAVPKTSSSERKEDIYYKYVPLIESAASSFGSNSRVYYESGSSSDGCNIQYKFVELCSIGMSGFHSDGFGIDLGTTTDVYKRTVSASVPLPENHLL